MARCFDPTCTAPATVHVRTPAGRAGVVRRLDACDEHAPDAVDEVEALLSEGERAIVGEITGPREPGYETNEEIAERVGRAMDESSMQHAPGEVVHSGPGVAAGEYGTPVHAGLAAQGEEGVERLDRRPDGTDEEIPDGVPGGRGAGDEPQGDPGARSEPGADPGQPPAGEGRSGPQGVSGS